MIKNTKELAINHLRQDALAILENGYEAVSTEKVISGNISLKGDELKVKGKKYNLKKYKNIFVVAVGKCANQSALVLEDILGDKITEGVVLDVEQGQFKKLKSEVGTHPFPSEQNILVTKLLLKVLCKVTKNDLVITVISGGGSALLCAPVEGLDGELLKQITQLLMKKGAVIGEMNIVRKHLSRVKGGQLAELVYPAQIISLIFSDVPGDDISSVASGPTVMDKSTKEDAQIILESYFSEDLNYEGDNFVSFLKETPKDSKIFEKVDNILLVSNKIALKAMQKKAEELNYVTSIESEEIQGEAWKLGKSFVNQEMDNKSCRIWGGETTVQIKGEGKGGRNQEFVLGALGSLKDGMLVAAVSSDGRDNTDVAGALADSDLLEKIEKDGVKIDEY